MTTDLTEQDIVMGRSEKRLFHAIKQAIDSYHPPAVFIYNTCVPALVGDDINAVCKSAQELWGVPVVPIDSAGFYGTKTWATALLGDGELCNRHRDPDPALTIQRAEIKSMINLIGEYNTPVTGSAAAWMNWDCASCAPVRRCAPRSANHAQGGSQHDGWPKAMVKPPASYSNSTAHFGLKGVVTVSPISQALRFR
jgi:hypothetical protein